MRESEKMEIKKLYEEGVSISELARRYGHDRKTIRKAVVRIHGTTREGFRQRRCNPCPRAGTRWRTPICARS